ncbi:hypothetical protein B296_00045817 [Ensete ventricosum]|uniref:Uncharacterized protein n=1 Tax=Ensete ventricosum TaxID=4639 RepID=A0A426Y305_ENSVE|nr:hypothetical protein B296_00045817 [Ensete ventricosum]
MSDPPLQHGGAPMGFANVTMVKRERERARSMSDPPLHAWRHANGVRKRDNGEEKEREHDLCRTHPFTYGGTPMGFANVTTAKRVVQKNEPWLSASQRSSIKLGAKLKRRDIKEKVCVILRTPEFLPSVPSILICLRRRRHVLEDMEVRVTRLTYARVILAHHSGKSSVAYPHPTVLLRA